MSAEVIDHVAREKAQRALDQLDGHENLCAERYSNIHTRLGNIVKLLGFGGATLATVVISIIGYLSVKLIDVNDSDKAVLRAKVEILEAQQRPTGSTAR